MVGETSPMVKRRASGGVTTLLFTDIVDSTRLAGEMGDQRWRELLSRHHRIVRAQLKRFGGREVDTAGDGFFATFEKPAAAIRCAAAILEGVRTLGIELRSGLHVGEVEDSGGQTRGIAVHISARIMSTATTGELFVSSTVRDLVTGSGFGFEDLGEHELKGVPDKWRLWRVVSVDGAPLSRPPDGAEALRRREAITGGASPLSSRRGLLIAAAAGIVLILAAAFFLTRGEGALDSLPVGSIGRIDADKAEITEAIELGSKPSGIAIGNDVLWTISLQSQTISRVDLKTGEVGAASSTDGDPTGMAYDGANSVWVLDQFPEGKVVQFDATSLSGDSIEAGGPGTNDIASDGESLWLTNELDSTLQRYDPATKHPAVVLRHKDLGAEPRAVCVGGGFVWVAAGEDIIRYDPANGSIDRKTLRFPAADIAFGEDAVWATHPNDDQVTKIDPESLGLVSITTSDGPTDVETGGGYAWVTSPSTGHVVRIDPSSNDTTDIDIVNSPLGLAVGEDVWVAVGAVNEP